MTIAELIELLEDIEDASGDWDVEDERGNKVTGVRITRRSVIVEVEE